ncbi:MAG: DotU family type IV/VI secretion system protein [Silvanigrellaceae bacterium]|nr:DotU family type IV/VI secretion system protein [Silvanigrellaceae bacterium]
MLDYSYENAESIDINEKNTSECQYLMVSIADEIFLRKSNIISDYWKDILLEYHFYGTRSSGTIIFEKIKKLISDADRNKTDIAYIYLSMLGLGFKGKYALSRSGEKIKLYKKELHSIITKYEEKEEKNDGRLFTNQLSIPKNIKEKFLPDIRRWYFYLFLLFLVYIAISIFIWFFLTTNLSNNLDKYNNILSHEINK